MEFKRRAERLAVETAQSFRTMIVSGPRQVGKTWLLTELTKRLGGYETVCLDDDDLQQLAKNDPKLFLQLHPSPLYVDEIQRAPELLPAMKMIVDASSRRGQFLMTGSQQFKMMRGAKESLAGRVGVLKLFGLSKAELEGRTDSVAFLPSLDVAGWSHGKAWDVHRVYDAIVKGGYPEYHAQPKLNVSRYFRSYIETYVERDIREMVDIANIGLFKRFMQVCAARTGQLLNYADLSRDAGISIPTARTWVSLLETSGLLMVLHPYYNNLIKRATKTPKLYFTDTGLCAHLLGITSGKAAIESPLSGALLETYVILEICKSHWYSGSDANFWFFRDSDGHEVDLLIEQDGGLYPIEVKRASSVRAADVERNFRVCREACSPMMRTGGVVLVSDTLGAVDAQTATIPVGFL